MRSAWEALVFFCAALAAHLLAFAITVESGEGMAPAGEGGTDPVTLAAASAELTGLVRDWDTEPTIVTRVEPVPSTPPILTAPMFPQPGSSSRLPHSSEIPEAPSPVAAERTPETPWMQPKALEPSPQGSRRANQDGQSAESGRPAPRPQRLPTSQQRDPANRTGAPQPAEASAQLRQSGDPGPVPGDRTEKAPHATASPGATASLIQIWGARIKERVRQALTYPQLAERRGITGQVMVELVVEPDGRVKARRVVATSGDAMLDHAALSAVDRARVMPPAPPGLPQQSISFELPVTFQNP